MPCRCTGQMPNCPSCGSPITENRNQLAERFAHKLPYPCTNQSAGCQFKSLLCDLASHEAACPHRLYCCVPCRPRCRWRGRRFQVRHEQDCLQDTSTCKTSCRTELRDGFDIRPITSVLASRNRAWFQASAAVSLRASLFWDRMQPGLIVTDVSGQHICSVFKGLPKRRQLSITLRNIPEQRSHDDTILRQHNDTAFTEEGDKW